MRDIRELRASLNSEAAPPPPRSTMMANAGHLLVIILLIVGGWHSVRWAGRLVFGTSAERGPVADRPAEKPDAVTRDPRRTVEFAPEGADVEVGKSFDENRLVREAYRNVRKSTSGYPIVVSLRAVPICASPFQIHEVEDAWKAKNIDWINKIPGCGMIPAGSFMEWTRKSGSIGQNSYGQFRIITDDGGRATFYAPHMDPEDKSWFGWYEIEK